MASYFRQFLILLLLLVAGTTVQAQTFPALTGRVVDEANIIPDGDEAALTAKLKGLEDQSGRQLVVATIPDLQGYPIEDYGYQLGRKWGIGQKKANNGVLLIVAPNDRKVRIEVGYGLEPVLTDLYSGVVIRDMILPRFKAGDYPGGINVGVDAISTQLTLPPDQAAARAKQVGLQSTSHQQRGGVDIGTVIFWLFIFFFFILPMLRSLFGGRGRRYGSGPVIIWGGGGGFGGGSSWGGGGGSSWGDGGGFSGGGGSFGGGGSSGSW